MDKGQLIEDIAKVTGVRISASDPIIAAAVINEILLNQALVKLDRQVKVEADRITAASQQSVVDTEKRAASLLTKGGEWADKRLREAADEAAATVIAAVRSETAKVERATRIALRAAWATAAAGFVVMAGLAGMVLAILH